MRFFRTFIMLPAVFAAGIALYGGDVVTEAADNEVSPDNFSELRADEFNVVGDNIVVSGNVYLPLEDDMELFADRAVVNVSNRDIEASGHIRLYRWSEVSGKVETDQLARLQKENDCRLSVEAVEGDIWGGRKVSVSARCCNERVTADRFTGNLLSRYFTFENAKFAFRNFVATAEFAERMPDGVINASNAEISGCEYLVSNNAHYSIGCTSATLSPPPPPSGDSAINKDAGEYSVLMTNSTLRIYGIPLAWLPVVYKPKDESLRLFQMQLGSSSDYGFFIRLSKKFKLSDYPQASVRLLGDYFDSRGFGYGISGKVETDNSVTSVFAYTIRDRNSDENDEYSKYRIDVPYNRYDFRISNLTHITPRLDFRGVFELQSDPYVTRDFFEDRYNGDPQPATYASLEYQFDHFSASLYVRPRVNSFYTTVQRLPEFKLEIPRQELFGTNVYYQGDLSLAYLKMSWLDYDQPPENELFKLTDYSTFRVDTTHFLYYPIRLGWLNIVPRAGVKMVGYSNSSSEPLSPEELATLLKAADPQGKGLYEVKNYNESGHGKFRFLGEIGVEASTKIHNTWHDLRSYWLQIDGLRHVLQPYINYTLIAASDSPDEILYFDDVDRLDDAHFIRIGMHNRLETRSGDKIKSLFSMENFWDFYMDSDDRVRNSHIGNIGTVLKANLIKDVTLSADILIDPANANGPIPETMRNGRSAGYPGLDCDWINRLNVSLDYTPATDWKFNLSYTYNRNYNSRYAYSMGSSMTQIDSGSLFNKFFDERTDQLSFSVGLPITPDHRTLASYRLSYDFLDGRCKTQEFQLIRRFHCVELSAGLKLEFKKRNSPRKGYTLEDDWMFQVNFLGMQMPAGSGSPALAEIDREMSGSAAGKVNIWKTDTD